MRDEFDEPNKVMRELMGVEETSLRVPASNGIQFEKQDLPFASPVDVITSTPSGPQEQRIEVFGAISRVKPASGVSVAARFADGSPALTRRQVDRGSVTYCCFLPGLSYFRPAIPKRPVRPPTPSTRPSPTWWTPAS